MTTTLSPDMDIIIKDCFVACVQISEEFYRITSRDLRATWNASLDNYVPRLIKLYRARKAAFGPDMEMLLNKLDEEVGKVPQTKLHANTKMTLNHQNQTLTFAVYRYS